MKRQNIHCPECDVFTIANYRKRLSDTWWLLSMRLRTRLGHGQYLFCAKFTDDREKSDPIKLSDAEAG